MALRLSLSRSVPRRRVRRGGGGNRGEPARGPPRRPLLATAPRDDRARGETDGRDAAGNDAPLARRRRRIARRANAIVFDAPRGEVPAGPRRGDAEATGEKLPARRDARRRRAHRDFRREMRRCSSAAHPRGCAATCDARRQRPPPRRSGRSGGASSRMAMPTRTPSRARTVEDVHDDDDRAHPDGDASQRRSRRRTEAGQGAEGGGRRLFEPVAHARGRRDADPDGAPASRAHRAHRRRRRPRDLSPATASVASTSEVVREAAALATNGAGASTVAFDDATVTMRGTGQVVVPVAAWYPTDGTGPTPTYPHAISVAKIARVLLNCGRSPPRGSWIATFPSNPPRGWSVRRPPTPRPTGFTGAVACATATSARGSTSSTSPRRSPRPGSSSPRRSLPNPSRRRTPSRRRRGPGAKPAANPSATRETVLNATLKIFDDGKFAWVDGDGERRSKAPVALVGQSAGASTLLPARRGRSRRGSPSRGSGERRARSAKKSHVARGPAPRRRLSRGRRHLSVPHGRRGVRAVQGDRGEVPRRCRRSSRGSTRGDCWIRFGRGTLVGRRS